MDITNERKQQVQAAAPAARQQQAALRAAQAAEFDSSNIDDGETNGSGPGPLTTLAVALVLAAVSIYSIKKIAPRLKVLWSDKAPRNLKKLKNRTTGDTTRTFAESSDDEDPSA